MQPLETAHPLWCELCTAANYALFAALMHARVPTYSGVAAVADHAGLFTFACSPRCAMFTFTSAPFCVLRALVWHHCDTQLLVRDLDETGQPAPEESFFSERGKLRLKVLDESRSNFSQQQKHRALQLCA